MKKLKLLSPILAASAAIAPTSLLSSCGKDYSELASYIQERTLSIFKDFSFREDEAEADKVCHRRTFDCGDIFNYIKDAMIKNGINVSGQDKWTTVPEVDDERKKIGADHGDYGNIWYDLEPTPGCEEWPAIMLQSHFDMTLQFNPKAPNARAYWEKYGVEFTQDNDKETMWTKSIHKLDGKDGPGENYMSLGADGGLGIAFMLALAREDTRDTFKHGPIRLMFTADEGGPTENFQTGAHLLAFDQKTEDGIWKEPGGLHREKTVFEIASNERPFTHTIKSTGEEIVYDNIMSVAALNSKYIYQSTAGMHECILSKTLTVTEDYGNVTNGAESIIQPGKHLHFYDIKVSGLYGGHSAEDINSGLSNALDLLFDCLKFEDPDFRIISVASGDNAYRIPSEAEATIVTTAEVDEMDERCALLEEVFQSASIVERDVISVDAFENSATAAYALNHDKSNQLVTFGSTLKFGPQTWYDKEHEEVRTSLNFCPLTIKYENDKMTLDFHITCRSGSKKELDAFSESVHWGIEESLDWLKDSLIDVKTDVWEKPRDGEKNPLVDLMYSGYKANKNNVELKNCHGWFEIACLPDAFEHERPPRLVCVGPTIEDAHTNNEILYFDSLIPVFKGILYTFENAQQLKIEE